ncbi:M16 family metallopeptidase [Salisediminibacterium halotolerans]|uniref:Predicted Zn-dependent peptidase n=1 Tax=Salisediminibacterium halotolerans TaxID=517425 RepID=A0A1H9Q9E8_9BACI|nr:pitrilysin family protein [Salisediminibacterium haloalkalitolerans]SER57047.1 Predicted Zn-dependent peptidase [Salisediminibacterium haloalkalitolerans]
MVERYVSDNGLRVVYEPIEHVRSVAIGIWVHTGSRYETAETRGMAHFIEHMLFKGTKTRSAQQIAEEFDAVGGQVNAMTSKEYTCFYAKVMDTHAEKALDILADMFFNSVFDPDEMEKEKQVIYEEMSMYEDEPDDLALEMLSEAVYQDHSLAAPILGTRASVASFTRDGVIAYMNDQYHAGNVVISISGHVGDDIVEAAQDRFSPLASGFGNTSLLAPHFIPGQAVRQKETEQAHICLGYEGVSLQNEQMYAMVLLNNAVGGSMSSRLFQEIRENRGLAYSVFSFNAAYQDTGMFTVYAGARHDQLDEVYAASMDILDNVSAKGLTEKEWQNGKEQLKGNLMLGLESTSSRMNRNGKNELLLNKHRSLDEVISRIDEVTMSDIQLTAAAVFSSEHASAVVSETGELPGKISHYSARPLPK